MTADVEALGTARRHLGMSFFDLWVAYIGVGGCCDTFQLQAYLSGTFDVGDGEHDCIVHAVNEALDDIHDDQRLPYRRP